MTVVRSLIFALECYTWFVRDILLLTGYSVVELVCLLRLLPLLSDAGVSVSGSSIKALRRQSRSPCFTRRVGT